FSFADSGWLRTKLPLQSGSAFCQAIDDDVKYGNDEHCQKCRRQHSAEHRGAQPTSGGTAGTGSDRDRDDTKDERKGCHENGPQSKMRGFYCSVFYRLAFLSSQLCVLHDQDCVLRGEADQGDDADLCVDVVSISTDIYREKGAKKSEWYRQY